MRVTAPRLFQGAKVRIRLKDSCSGSTSSNYLKQLCTLAYRVTERKFSQSFTVENVGDLGGANVERRWTTHALDGHGTDRYVFTHIGVRRLPCGSLLPHVRKQCLSAK